MSKKIFYFILTVSLFIISGCIINQEPEEEDNKNPPCLNFTSLKRIYWSGGTNPNGFIKYAEADNTSDNQTVLSGLAYSPGKLQIDSVRNKIYWKDNDNCNLMRANLDGTGVETIIIFGDSFDFCLDLINAKIYIAYTDRIQDANLDGSDIGFGFDINFGEVVGVQKIAIDASDGILFWAKGFNIYKKTSINSLNTDITQIYTGEVQFGFDLDIKNNYIYFLPNLLIQGITRIDYNGANGQDITTFGECITTFAVDFVNDKLFSQMFQDASLGINQSDFNGTNIITFIPYTDIGAASINGIGLEYEY